MTAAHVRRGGGGTAKPRKAAKSRCQDGSPRAAGRPRPGQPACRAGVRRLPARDREWSSLVALDIPAKAERSAGAAVGRAGFIVSGYQIVGLKHMDRARSTRSSPTSCSARQRQAGAAKAPQPLVDVAAIRDRLLQFGWIKDARVSRRLPDTLVIDIVERTPAALWQNKGQLALIDAEGVVLDRVPINKMPDLPLADRARRERARRNSSTRLMAGVPTLKPQLASATWVGGRRWDLNFQSGETVALPEGDGAARPRWRSSPSSTSRAGCSAAASCASTCAFPAR